MKPFNLQEALAHPERVRHKDGRKAVQVFHSERATEAHRVIVVWEDGNVFHYTENGKSYSRDKEPILYLASEPERVPFSVEGWKKGCEVIYRNGKKPLEIHVFEKATAEFQPVTSVLQSGTLIQHCITGHYYDASQSNALDLLLIKPAE